VVLCLAVYFQSAHLYSDLNADIKVTFLYVYVFIGICGKCMVLFFFVAVFLCYCDIVNFPQLLFSSCF